MFVGTRLVLVLYVCWFAGLATLLRNLSPTIRWDPKKQFGESQRSKSSFTIKVLLFLSIGLRGVFFHGVSHGVSCICP